MDRPWAAPASFRSPPDAKIDDDVDNCFRFAKSASASACFEWSFVRPSVEDLLLQAKGACVRATREQCVHEVWGGATAHI